MDIWIILYISFVVGIAILIKGAETTALAKDFAKKFEEIRNTRIYHQTHGRAFGIY